MWEEVQQFSIHVNVWISYTGKSNPKLSLIEAPLLFLAIFITNSPQIPWCVNTTLISRLFKLYFQLNYNHSFSCLVSILCFMTYGLQYNAYSLYQDTLCCFSSVTLHFSSLFVCDSSNNIFAHTNSNQECDTVFASVGVPDTTLASTWSIFSSNMSTPRHMCN